MIIRGFMCLLSVVFLTAVANAAQLQSLAEIEQAAYLHASNDAQANYDNPQVIVDPLDERLRLTACSGELQSFSNSAPNTLGSRTIGISCPLDTGWTVYVSTQVKVFRNVVVAARPLSANSVLEKDDIKITLLDISNLRHGYLQKTEQAIGQQLKYALSLGSVLAPQSLKVQKIVQRGEQVTLVASAGSMQVRMQGTAMADAALGEVIKVKNSSSKRIVEGVVDAPGIVKVNM